MIIIMSSAYLSAEFQVELGAIPPVFLPIGNRKLIEHQVAALRETFGDDEIILSLPESFYLTETYKEQLERLNIEVEFVPDTFSLSESVLYLLNIKSTLFEISKPLSILYGDTFISDYAFVHKSENLIAISEAKNSYDWEYVETEDGKNLVWCGFFLFANKPLLLKSLALKRDSFNAAIKYYCAHESVDYGYTQNWSDLGHVNTYFASRANLTTQRAFNDLQIVEGIVSKSGDPQRKIEAEAAWFTNVPPKIKQFTPLFLGSYKKDGRIFYDLEYLACMPLNELFVHGQNRLQDWRIIFNEINKWFTNSLNSELMESQESVNSNYLTLIREKTLSRVQKFAIDNHYSLIEACFYDGKELPSITDIVEECLASLILLQEKPGILHGDLCFSNMLFDSRSLKLKVIDPRGLSVDNNFTIYGDVKYDLAKLTHSVIGLYDFIISGNYQIQNPNTKEEYLQFDIDERVLGIQSLFLESEFIADISVKEVLPLVILLFFSMLPLHSDRPDRQRAMLLNGFRLYLQLYFK